MNLFYTKLVRSNVCKQFRIRGHRRAHAPSVAAVSGRRVRSMATQSYAWVGSRIRTREEPIVGEMGASAMPLPVCRCSSTKKPRLTIHSASPLHNRVRTLDSACRRLWRPRTFYLRFESPSMDDGDEERGGEESGGRGSGGSGVALVQVLITILSAAAAGLHGVVKWSSLDATHFAPVQMVTLYEYGAHVQCLQSWLKQLMFPLMVTSFYSRLPLLAYRLRHFCWILNSLNPLNLQAELIQKNMWHPSRDSNPGPQDLISVPQNYKSSVLSTKLQSKNLL